MLLLFSYYYLNFYCIYACFLSFLYLDLPFYFSESFWIPIWKQTVLLVYKYYISDIFDNPTCVISFKDSILFFLIISFFILYLFVIFLLFLSYYLNYFVLLIHVYLSFFLLYKHLKAAHFYYITIPLQWMYI